MKSLFPLLLLAFIAFGCNTNSPETEINIIEVDDFTQKVQGSHHDVVINVLEDYSISEEADTTHNSRTYKIHIFRLNEDSVRGYAAYYSTDEQFDNASYIWTNDSTANIILKDKNQSRTIILQGYGATTSMDVID